MGLQIIVPVISLELAGIALPTGAAIQYLPQEPDLSRFSITLAYAQTSATDQAAP